MMGWRGCRWAATHVAVALVSCVHATYMPFSMNLATSSRSVQVHLLMSQSASINDLDAHAANITTTFRDFLARGGSAGTTVNVVDANVIGMPELSDESKGQLEVTLDVALSNTASRTQVVQAWHNTIMWSGVKTSISSLPLRFNLLDAVFPWKLLWDSSFANIPRQPLSPYVSLYLVLAQDVATSPWLRIRVKHAIAFVLGVSPAALHVSTDWTYRPPRQVYSQPTTVVLVVIELVPSSATHRDEVVEAVQTQRVVLQDAIRAMANLTLLACSIEREADEFIAGSTNALSLAVQPLLFRTPQFFPVDAGGAVSSSIYLHSFARQSTYSLQTIHQDVATYVTALNAATDSTHLPVWHFNRLIFLDNAVPWPPPDNNTQFPGSSLVIDLIVDATYDSFSTILDQTQNVMTTFAGTWVPSDTSLVQPTAATTWLPHLRFACEGPLTHSIAQVRVAFAALFNVSYTAIQCVFKSTTNQTTVWELEVRDPWHRASLLTRFGAVELWHDSFLPFVDAPPPICSIQDGADGIMSALPALYPSSATPWNDEGGLDVPPVCLVRSKVPLLRPTSAGAGYGSPPSSPCISRLCVELSLMSAQSAALVLDLVEASPNVIFVSTNSTALLVDQFATWKLQTPRDVLDVILYFRFANSNPPADASNTSDVALAVRLHVLQTDNVREITVTPLVGGPVRLTSPKRVLQETDGREGPSPVTVTLQLPRLDPPTPLVLPNPECDYLIQQCLDSSACLEQYNCMPYLVFSQLLLDDPSTAVAGTVSDITDNVLSCFEYAADAAWRVHTAAIQCALARPHYLHHATSVMTTLQQPNKPRQTCQLAADVTLTLTLTLKGASLELVVDQSGNERFLADRILELVAAEAAAVSVRIRQALRSSDDGPVQLGWELIVEYTHYVGALPQATCTSSTGIVTMQQVDPHLVLAVVATPHPLAASPPAPAPSPAMSIVGANDRCAPCHDLILACMQSPACAAVTACAGASTSRALLMFPLGYVEAMTPDQLGACQDRAPSNAVWRQFIATSTCFARFNCPTETNAVDRMVALAITSASHTLRLPRRVPSTRLMFRWENGTVAASVHWTNTTRPADVASSLQLQLAKVTTISTVLVTRVVGVDDDVITIVYKDHVGRLPQLAALTAGQGLTRRIESTEASLVKTIKPFDPSQYIVSPSPCPCGEFTSAFAGALASVANSVSPSQPFVDIASLLEQSATPSDVVATSCYAARFCPLAPPAAHSAILVALTPTVVTLLLYPTATGLATSTYSADFTVGPVVLRVSPKSTGSSLLSSWMDQGATLSPDVTIDQACDEAGVCRVDVTLPNMAGPLPAIDVQSTTNANNNAFTTFGNQGDEPERHQRVTLRLF